VQAGKSETKRSITNVLNHVVDHYKYTSLQELNSILKQYNVQADRGHEDGRIYKNRGLLYSVINEEGKQMTKPIKASEIYNKPTLDRIEHNCKQNEITRETERRQLKATIDWAMLKEPRSLGELAKELQKERIVIVASRSAEGKIFGLTYIDHENKSVFKGSDVGKEYAAKKMLERFNIPDKEHVQQQEKVPALTKPDGKEKDSAPTKEKESQQEKSHEPQPFKESISRNLLKGAAKIIEQIIEPDSGSSAVNRELTEEEKRKRRRQQEFENE
jgi:hypothetical protein